MNQTSAQSDSARTESTNFPQCVYIAGTGRNGSTLLGMLLSQHPRVFFAGELTHIWKRGFQQNQLCSCGQPFLCCEFWRAVAEDSFGNDCDARVSEMVRVSERVSSFRNLPGLVMGVTNRKDQSLQHCRVYRDLLSSIARVSGCTIIVDSSKYPTDLAAFIQANVPIKIVHLIRDCRAVVYSWRTQKPRPEIHWKDEDMPHYGPVQTAIAWRTFNSLIEKISMPVDGSYRLLRYEDLVMDTPKHYEQLLNWIGLKELDIEKAGASLDHSVSGNPCRFKSGPLRVAIDDRWRDGLSRSERMLVKLLCGSMQKRYGYED